MGVDVIEVVDAREADVWRAWPVYWSAIWVGALAAIALVIVFGLVSAAVGAHEIGTGSQIAKWSDVSRLAVVLAVFGAFLSAALGGWVAGKISGIRRAEPAMLHGAITWLLTIPVALSLIALGAGNAFGGWYGGLMGSPAWMATPSVPTDLTAAMTARNDALAALTALLLGLMGSVIGGWLASGEPMTFTYHRTRDAQLRAAR